MIITNNKLFHGHPESIGAHIRCAIDTGDLSEPIDWLKAFFILEAWPPLTLRANKKPINLPKFVGVRIKGISYFADNTNQFRNVDNQDFTIEAFAGQSHRTFLEVLKNLLHRDQVKKLWFDMFTAEITTTTGEVLYFTTAHSQAYWGEKTVIEGEDIAELKKLIN